MLSHEWWVRDARTDARKDSPRRHKMTDNTCLYNIKITSDTKTDYVIPRRTCFDLSGHCAFWNRYGKECENNPNFMHEACALTCQLCEKDVDEDENADDDDVVNDDDNNKENDSNDGSGNKGNEQRKSSNNNDEL